MPGPAAGDDNPAAGRGSAGEAPARDVHVREALPAVARESEVESVGGGGGQGVAKGITPGVEVRTAEDVEVAPDGDSGEIGEAV